MPTFHVRVVHGEGETVAKMTHIIEKAVLSFSLLYIYSSSGADKPGKIRRCAEICFVEAVLTSGILIVTGYPLYYQSVSYDLLINPL